MKVLLCQTRTKMLENAPAVPFPQLVLASYIEDVAEVRITGIDKGGILPSNDDILKEIDSFLPDVVGVTIEYAIATSNSVDLAKKIRMKHPEIEIIAGGHQATFIAEDLLRAGYFDVIFIGEGEESLREYVVGKKNRNIRGCKYLDAATNAIMYAGPRPLLDLSRLKPPAYHLLRESPRIIMAIESSRGCPYRCNYCETKNFFGSGIQRKLTKDNFMKSLCYSIENGCGFNLFFTDDCFTADMKHHVKPICEDIIERGISANFSIQGRVDHLSKNADMLPLMKRAGFNTIILGIESIYDSVLSRMTKNAQYNKQNIQQLLKMIHDNGISAFGSVIFGYPGETSDMVMETIDFLLENGLDILSPAIATPLPGSDLFQTALADGQILTQDYDLYDYRHRVWSVVPEDTEQAVADARRRFYLNSKSVSKKLHAIFDVASVNFQKFQIAAIMNYEWINPIMSQPRNEEDWINLLTGVSLASKDLFKGGDRQYSDSLVFRIQPGGGIEVTVTNGILTSTQAKHIADNQWDFRLSADAMIKLFSLSPSRLDGISALLLKMVEVNPAADMRRIFEFCIWLRSFQAFLRDETQLTCHELKDELNRILSTDVAVDGVVRDLTTKHSNASIRFGDAHRLTIAFSREKARIKFIQLEPYARAAAEGVRSDYQVDPMALRDGTYAPEDLLRNCRGRGEIEKPQARKSGPSVQTFFENLVKSFRPECAQTISKSIQYVIHDGAGKEKLWRVCISAGTVSVKEVPNRVESDLTISVLEEKFLETVRGDKAPYELVFSGQMKILGDPNDLFSMTRCFR